MTEAFDSYHKWLGIPPAEQPPNYYRLIAVPLFEEDSDVIDTAANQTITSVSTGTLPLGSAIDPTLTKAYVVNNGGQSVSVIYVPTNTVIKTIPGMGGQPAGIAVDTVVKKAIVAQSDAHALAVT